MYLIIARLVIPIWLLVAAVLLISNLVFRLFSVINTKEFFSNIPFALFWPIYVFTVPGRAKFGMFFGGYFAEQKTKRPKTRTRRKEKK